MDLVVCVCVCVCCVCVLCVCGRERERKRNIVCVCVRVCSCAYSGVVMRYCSVISVNLVNAYPCFVRRSSIAYAYTHTASYLRKGMIGVVYAY